MNVSRVSAFLRRKKTPLFSFASRSCALLTILVRTGTPFTQEVETLEGNSTVKRIGQNNELICMPNKINLAIFPRRSFCCEASGFTRGEGTVAGKIAHILEKGAWDSNVEQALRDLAPSLSAGLVIEVLSLDIGEESALGFFSWAGKQDGYEHDREIVRETAYILASNYGPDKLSCLQEKINARGSEVDEAVWAVMIIANEFLKRSLDACTVFMQMKKSGCKPASLSYEALLTVLVKSKRCDAALLTCQEMLNAGFFPDSDVLGGVFLGLCKVGRSDVAHEFVLEVRRLGHMNYLETAYSRLITSVWRTGREGMVLELMAEMKDGGLRPDKHAYTVCIKLLCRTRRSEEAQKLLDEMIKQDCAPDLLTYNTLINGLNRAGKSQEALEVVDLMKANGCPPDGKIYTEVLKSLFTAGRIDDALKSFDQMLKEGCIPDIITYFTLVKNLCQTGKVDLAVDVKNTMSKKGCQPDSRLYLVLAEGLCKARQYEQVLNLISEMRGRGYAPNAEVYNNVVSHLCSTENFDQARTLVKEMISRGHKPTPYICIRFGDSLS